MVAVEDVMSEQDTSNMMGGVLSSVLQPKQLKPSNNIMGINTMENLATRLLPGVSVSDDIIPPEVQLGWRFRVEVL